MADNVIHDRTDLPEEYAGPVVLVNVFTPKAGKLDEFIAVQTGEYRRLLGKVAGWRGNRLHRSLDGKTAVNYAVFESLSAYKAWRGSDLFAEHLKVIEPLVERSEPGLYSAPLYEAGSV
ncbi:MAG: antibiotic biosynthesis monooxygenase [Verrucomicrobiales bacterium]|nr:antibiotic biosynthesis monooxygenase [Verrucomicrobiales bacterium]